MDIILYAVPGFLLLIVLELIAEKVRGTNYYRLNDAITSLATGNLSQLQKVVELMVPFTIYIVVYENFALFSLPESSLVWVLAFVAYDLSYYWLHRFGHEMNVMWASHVIHHSSEEYNLTTALRQTRSGFLGFIFYMPMALLGIDPLMVLTVGALNLIYQYWVHTRHIGKLGWYELFFVTPSNHRVHHAQNGVYIDRNYGGVFILWDRWFGTFQEELDEAPVIFGIRGAIKSWNPVWANLQIYSQLIKDCFHTKSWWYKLTIWFRKTGWRPPDVVNQYPLIKTDLDNFKKFDTQLSFKTKLYATLQYTINAGVGIAVIINLDKLLLWQESLIILFVILSSYSLGIILEKRAFAAKLEFIKNTVLIVFLSSLFNINLFVVSAVILSVFSLVLLLTNLESESVQTA